MQFHQLINPETMSEYVDMLPGAVISRSITDGGLTDLEGGHVKWVEDAPMHGLLGYDEIIYVEHGEVEMSTQDGSFVARAGDSFVLKAGADAHYFAKAGTQVFFITHATTHDPAPSA